MSTASPPPPRITLDAAAGRWTVDGASADHADGLAALRRRDELSRRDLGARLGVSARTVEAWEHRRRVPATSVLHLVRATLL
jgi:DNA-binding XRE family transcriptional regulator